MSMTHVYLQDFPRAAKVVADALPMAIAHDRPEVVEHRCTGCGQVMLYPLIARSVDVERMDVMLRTIERFAKAHGITSWALQQVIDECTQAIQRREDKD